MTAWTEEMCTRAQALLAEGYSGSQIANELGGGLTRNAVIGVCFRHGWKGPKSKGPSSLKVDAPRKPRKRKAVPRKATTHRPMWGKNDAPAVADDLPPASADDSNIPIEQRKTLVELREDTCHWPCGEPGDESFFFCGGQVAKGSYCIHHFRRSVTSKAYGVYAWHQ